MIEALQTIVAACKGHGIRAALHCGTADYAARAIGWGFDMTTVVGRHPPACRRRRGERRPLPRTDRVRQPSRPQAGKGGY